ncbi:MAG: hypothetical protein ABIP75_02935 [Pyrinomonadaceae bacterium]
MNKKILAVVCLVSALSLSLLCSSSQAQSLGPAAIKTTYGYLFVYNGKDKSYTMEIRGKTITTETAGENPAFVVDGNSLQMLAVVNENFLQGLLETDEDKMLALHQKWESEYLMNEMYHRTFNVDSESLSVGGRKMRFWGFKRPGFNDNFDRDYQLTTIVGSKLVGLSSALRPNEIVADGKKLMVDVLSTIKISDKPFDVMKLAEQIGVDARPNK